MITHNDSCSRERGQVYEFYFQLVDYYINKVIYERNT